MSDSFDPKNHEVAPPRGFGDLTVGEVFNLPSRTVTESHFAAFQMLSGDNHPIHYDREYCARRGHKDLLAHGLQVLCFSASGAGAFPHVVGDSLIAFVEMTAQFKAGVYIGDTLYPALEIIGLTRQNTTGIVEMLSVIRNQEGTIVLDGTQKYLLKLK